MGLVSRGAAWLTDKLMDAASAPITYTRGATTITLGADGAALTAIVGLPRRRRNESRDQRIALDGQAQDFQIRPGDLVINGLAIEPDRGDRIGWNGNNWDVRPRDGEPCWSPSDGAGELVRVRTVRVN